MNETEAAAPEVDETEAAAPPTKGWLDHFSRNVLETEDFKEYLEACCGSDEESDDSGDGAAEAVDARLEEEKAAQG